MSKPFLNTFGRKRPDVDIRRDFYTMASMDGENAEITMYGEIVDAQPVDYWTGKPIEGEYIIQKEFLDDLEALSNAKSVTIRMNSLGGDAGVSILIHNRLRELAANGVALTCIVDGVAMSGGSLIMCACDTVIVNPSSLVMIHKCWSFLFGGYNSDEMRQMADANDAWDKAQAAIYKRKCGLSDTVISHMMGATTYMTGTEAIEKGFADKLLEDAEPLNIASSADGRSLFVRGREMHLAPGMFAPDTIPTVKSGGTAPVETNTKTPDSSGKEGGTNSMPKTLEELRSEYPEQVAQLEAAARASGTTEVNAAVQAERKRIQDIDAIAGLYDYETVQAAKYGENACTAQEMAYRAAQKEASQGKSHLSALEGDTSASGAQEVGAAPSDPAGGVPQGAKTPEQMMQDARAAVHSLFGKKEG